MNGDVNRLLHILAIAALFFLADTRSFAADAWRPAAAPLHTRWTKDVSPTSARPDYPRPQFARKEWQSLNGLWEFGFDDANTGRANGWSSGKSLPDKILVPWTFEASLSGIGKGTEVHEHVWYRRSFEIPAAWQGKRIILHFGAVDWETTVWVNGHEVGTHRGGYTPFSFDITEHLKQSGSQELAVAVFDPADPAKGAFQPKGKQLGSKSIWYTRTTGIWQSVWLEPLSPLHIGKIVAVADVTAGELILTIKVEGEGRARIQANVAHGGKHLALTSATADGGSTVSVTLPVESPRLWTPATPNLYNIELSLFSAGAIRDEVKTYTAFRTVGVKDKRVTLNGKPYFLRGVLDQGFWPDGIYTPPTDDAIKNDVLMTKAFGFNLARKHVKVEDPRWYYYCDLLGLAVAQDMPSSHNLQTEAAKKNFVAEWRETMAAVRAHPSVLLWIPFNENWGDPKEFQDLVVDMTHAADPSRPVIDASGWTQRAKTDIIDIHEYGNDLKKHVQPQRAKPTWIGEYGGIALPVTGHTWVKGWGYQVVKTPDELVEKYRFLTDQINNAPGLSGFVYTQLTDVEQELNGLMTYDRQPKAPPVRFADINLHHSDKR